MSIIQIQSECINTVFIVFYLAYVVCHCLHRYSTYYVKLQSLALALVLYITSSALGLSLKLKSLALALALQVKSLLTSLKVT